MSVAETAMEVPQFLGEGRIEFIEKPIPLPEEGQLLVRIKANALCGSERGQFFHGSEVTPGHEAAGVVAVAGPRTQTSVGTPGVVFLMGFCGFCRNCRLGFTNQCLDKRCDMGFNRDGGYGRYALVDEDLFFAVDTEMSLTEATLLLDIMSTGGHAIRRGRLVHLDVRSLLITGAGPIGLGILAMAKLLLGERAPVLISDVIPYRLELAEKLGGLPVPIHAESLGSAMKRHGIIQVDLAIDSSGRRVARESAMQVLDQRGVLVCVGHGEDLHLNVSRDLIGSERSVLGSEYFCYDELSLSLELFRQHRSYLAQIITHRYPLPEIQTAFETFFEGNTGKVVVEQ